MKFIKIVGRIDGHMSERPMALDLEKVLYFIPGTPWRSPEKGTVESETEITAIMDNGAQIIFTKNAKNTKMTYVEFIDWVQSIQRTPETIFVENAPSKVSGKKSFLVRS